MNCNTGRAARCSTHRCVAGGRGDDGTSIPLAHVDEMPSDRCDRGHGRRHEVGAALVALAAFEVAVGGRGAAFARCELVGVHRKAHRAAGLAPFEACRDENLVEPFRFACALTNPEPGTIMALTLPLTLLPSTTLATSRKSSMRALVHEPMKTRSTAMSVIFSPPCSPIYLSARSTASRLFPSAMSSRRGTRPVTEITCSGLVPQVTSGGSLAASSRTSRSNCAPSSACSVAQ